MAIPAVAAAAGIGGGLSLGSTIAGGLISGAQSSKAQHDARNFALMQGDIEWNRTMDAWAMANRQNQLNWMQQNWRDDEVWNRQNEYNMGLWGKQNAYNSPAAQMARYREAGLNPNLIYGQSNMGGSVATANLESGKFGPVSTPHGTRPGNVDFSRDPMKFDLTNGIMSYINLREKAAQIDNLKELNKVYAQEAVVKAATALKIGSETKGIDFDNSFKSELRQTSADALKANLRKVTIESDVALRRDQREAASNTQSIAESAQRIKNLQGEKLGKDLENQMKALDLKLYDKGIRPSDNLIFRILGRIFGDQFSVEPMHWDEKNWQFTTIPPEQ